MTTYFITTGTAGDVMPFIEMARSSSLGQQAIVVANEKFRGMVLAQGVGFLPHSSLREYEAAINDPALWSRDLVKATRAAVKGFNLPTALTIKELLKEIDTDSMIIAHPLCISAFDSPLNTYTAVVSPAMLETPLMKNCPPGIGLWPHWFHGGNEQIRPSDFRILVEDIPIIDGDIHRLLEQDPVLITFGSAARTKIGWEVTEAAIKACIEREKKVLLIGGSSMNAYEELVTHVPYMPLWYPLKRVSIMIHHGGIGTAALCFRTGTKQIIHPFGLDQFDVAGRCLQLGEQVVMDHDFGHALDRALPAT